MYGLPRKWLRGFVEPWGSQRTPWLGSLSPEPLASIVEEAIGAHLGWGYEVAADSAAVGNPHLVSYGTVR